MNYFPNIEEEKLLLEFIAKYQYINTNDTKYFFKSIRYYKKRISYLVENDFLKRIKWNLVLGKSGIEYIKLIGLEYNKLNRNEKYMPRLLYISNIGAFYNNCKDVTFTPSFLIKDKEVFTNTARKFIGILNIRGIDYLTYHIPETQNNKYKVSVIYDIQKEHEYKNIIIFIDNFNNINIEDFVFGDNQVLLIEDTESNKEKLKYLYNINWINIINEYYKDKIYLSEYSFCDYTDYKNKYVSTFYFFDSEKINRIKYFLRENKNKNADIICSKEIKPLIQKELPDCNYIEINLDDYIEKELNIYE